MLLSRSATSKLRSGVSFGSGLAHGWLEGRLALIDWQRLYLQGVGLPYDNGNRPHNDRFVYRGQPPRPDE